MRHTRQLLVFAATGLALTAPLASMAQTGHMTHTMDATASARQPAMTDGIVRKVDKTSGTVTIAHEPLMNLGMPKMTMTFLVKDRAWLDTLKEGSKIRFVAESVKGELTVVALDRSR